MNAPFLRDSPHGQSRDQAVTELPLRWRGVAVMRRCLLALFVLGQTAVATYYLLWVLPYHGGTLVEIGLLVLFALLYAWIAVGFWTAVFGFVIRLLGGDRYSLLKRYSEQELECTPLTKTAVVMPIYHEPVGWTFSGLKAVYQDIERTGHIDQFEFYILSDSRNPDVWLQEQAAWYRLCRELGAEGRIFYRRRTVNLNYKSGNIADFLRRWGRRYRYMAVLDADSLLSGHTLVRMVRLMEREPGVGILQTVPTVINGQSLFARVQQFANRLYSPLFATGLAAIQMGDATFWGHNAMIRVEPFMQHCGLRKLPGFGIFRGPIMSHDFVEAAYMGRAGYEVWLEPGLAHSYEESPPTLADELARDRRWAKGNLQHLWVMLFGRHLRLAHRLAFLNGIMAYLSSALWLAFLILTTIEAAQISLWPIDYFPEGHNDLFPLWPEWRPEWALGLALSTLALLFLPKFIALADAVIHRTVHLFGGFRQMFASVLTEIVLSVLLAPIRMWAHSRYVLGALLNVSLKWAGQNRTEETTWTEAFVTQLPGLIIGVGWSAFAWNLDPLFFLWSLPVAIPLVLATPTSVLLSRNNIGRACNHRGLLVIPENLVPIQLLDDASHNRQSKPDDCGLTPFEEAVVRPRVNAIHQALARNYRLRVRAGHIDLLIERCAKQGPGSLSPSELSLLCRDRASLSALHSFAWHAHKDSYWGLRIKRLADHLESSTIR